MAERRRDGAWLADVLTVPPPAATPVPVPPLLMENGIGGFTEDGREYVVVLEGDRETPLPWSNVLANPEFGTMVSASGSAFTWAENSREHRLTPFANDPVSDPTGEAIYIRDEETGAVWGATPGPLPRRARWRSMGGSPCRRDDPLPACRRGHPAGAHSVRGPG